MGLHLTLSRRVSARLSHPSGDEATIRLDQVPDEVRRPVPIRSRSGAVAGSFHRRPRKPGEHDGRAIARVVIAAGAEWRISRVVAGD